jgi:hypothetical protein
MDLIIIFAIEIKLDTHKTLFSQIFTFEKKKLIKFIINLIFKIKIYMKNYGHFGQLKMLSKKGLHIWMERTTFHNVPSLVKENSPNTGNSYESVQGYSSNYLMSSPGYRARVQQSN